MIKSNAVLYAERSDEFYPTPAPLLEKMFEGVDWRMIQNILEPSAGKGDIVRYILEKRYDDEYAGHHWRHDKKISNVSIDCIEIDPNLRAVLNYNFSEEKAQTFRDNLWEFRDKHSSKLSPEDNARWEALEREDTICRSKAVKVIFDDFLKYRPFKEYDLIVMNPPFSNGCTHLLKALDIMKDGGAVICLLNAETLRNPYTDQRRELKRLLNVYGATIEYIEGGFAESEHKTDVEVALIKVFIPQKVEESEFFERMKKAENVSDDFGIDPSTELDVVDYIKSAVTHFNVEVGAGIELIRQCRAFNNRVSGSLRITISSDRGYSSVTTNEYLVATRLKYWTTLLSNPKFTGKLTSKLREEYHKKVDRLKDYDFNEFNIQVLSTEMMAQVKRGIEDEIGAMFDRLTADHTFHVEISKNRHYYDGWSTNKAWKIDKKVILPCYGVFSDWDGRPQRYKAVDVLSDIEKILNFFDGNMTADVNLAETLESNFKQGVTKNIPCKYFSATFYKKGTVHLVFTCPDLIERFNIYAAQNRGWLPPSYGKKKYKDMTEAERHVVDTFQGEKKYAEVLQKAGYYLASPVRTENMMLLGDGE